VTERGVSDAGAGPPPTLTTDFDGRVLVARVQGDIDVANAEDLAAEIAAAVPNAALGVVIDLERVTYLDSSGVRMIFVLADRLQHRQQALRVAAPASAPLRRVLDLVDLGATVPLVETADQAVRDIVAAAE
jgi:anti-anti-sigma factor